MSIFLCVSCSHTEKITHEIPPLEDGDIICRLGNGMFSNLFRMQSEEQIYSHIGIVRLANDSVFIIHAEANELSGEGHVKAEPWQDFIDNSRKWGLYRMNSDVSTRRQIAHHAFHYVEQHVPFDMEFNLHNDNRVYCTELAALAINRARGETRIVPGGKIGSILFYSIDDIYRHPDFICIYKTP